jgi:hypothetical protein
MATRLPWFCWIFKCRSIDGFRVAEHIKNRPGIAGTTVMMLDSVGQHGDAQRCRELGHGVPIMMGDKAYGHLYVKEKQGGGEFAKADEHHRRCTAPPLVQRPPVPPNDGPKKTRT